MAVVKVGICGLGTVGSGVFNLLASNAAEIERKTGQQIRVVQVGCRRDHPDVNLGQVAVSRDIFAVADNPDVDIVCEMIGGLDDARTLIKQALNNGKHVVTANKALIAVHGDELFTLASEKGVSLKFEAAIAGGIPIVKAVRESLAGNSITRIAGIINGTSNFILTEMAEDGRREFAEVLLEAQQLGYAEADPTFDVEGIDAAHKLTILSSIAFGVPLRFDAIYTEGIANITLDDVRYAREFGYRIKHLGVTTLSAHGVELRVHPALVEESNLLARVDGVMNAVLVDSDAAGQTLYYGAGAGAGPTASSVVADLVDIARNEDGNGVADLGFVTDAIKARPILTIHESQACQYLRLQVQDRPGVLARISSIMGEHDISIESLIQKDPRGGLAPIAIITDRTLEADILKAVDQLEALPDIVGNVSRIRVETL